MLIPDYYYRSVLDIDLPRDSGVISDEIKRWATNLCADGFKACLVSNNWHERVVRVAEELGFDLVAKAVKPLPFAFLAALRRAGSTRDQAAVVGDQLFTDVLGGKLLGVKTVLVAPLSSADLPHTLLLRRLERVLLAGRTPLP